MRGVAEYVGTLGDRINGRAAVADDARAFFRGELKTLDADLKNALGKSTDRATRLHIEDVENQIAHALDPRFRAPERPRARRLVRVRRSMSSTSAWPPTRAGWITPFDPPSYRWRRILAVSYQLSASS